MDIILEGVNQNNLKNISVKIPKNQLVVFTGISGSGKSTVVFDVIYAEAQRQYLESVSTFSRISLPRFGRPDFSNISGLSPAIVINQKQMSSNPRSTVGTITEIYSYLRLLYSRFGTPRLNAGDFSFNTPSGACENCSGTGKEIQVNKYRLIDFSKSLNQGAIRHRTYKVNGRLWNIIAATDFFDMDKKIRDYSEEELNKLLYAKPQTYYNNALGFVQNFSYEGIASRILHRARDSRGLEGSSYDSMFTTDAICHVCNGSRVNERARSVLFNNKTIVELTTIEIQDLAEYLKSIDNKYAKEILDFIVRMLQTIIDLGLGYLTLSRTIGSLSNGESQRLKLARQLSSSLTDLIYILDEPTSGLHAKDVRMIANTLGMLVKKQNTVIVVEHDKSVISNADYIVEMGPYAGQNGGEVVFTGSYQELLAGNTITAQYLLKGPAGNKKLRKASSYIDIIANRNNLHNLKVKIPKGLMVCITGVSGSGKSSLVSELIDQVNECIIIDQSRIGTNSRSNPVTYVGVFDEIRNEFANASGQPSSIFAFNSKGACEKCKGLGYEMINMHFLGDIKIVCDECCGRRYSVETLQYEYMGKNIADVLEMTVDEALSFFNKRSIQSKLQILSEVGLGYLTLGQSFDTLSGGEAQRIKLASGLSRDSSIFILDEPTRGLHMYDVYNLLKVLNKIVNNNNTVIVVEHNMDVIKNADHIIDLGPGAGRNGGNIVAEGTPIDIIHAKNSHTAEYLKYELQLND
jgi:excinuclease UvrABC ATPase subunit